MTSTNTAEQIAEFASVVYSPGDIVEIRNLRKGDAYSTWHCACDLASVANHLARDNAAGWNIYFGVNPRPTFGAKGNESIGVARCVFADFDHAVESVVADILAKSGLPTPTMMLNSGHGIHVYWLLLEPLYDLAQWTEYQKDLAAHLGSDSSVTNPERIMRVPGFVNHKAPAADATLIHCDVSNAHDFTVMVERTPARPAESKAAERDEAEKVASATQNHKKTSAAGRNGTASVIDTFNDRHDIMGILLSHGYTHGRGGKLIRPGGETPSVSVSDGRSIHFSTDDPLNDGKVVPGAGVRDAFDVYAHFEHGGNIGAAVKAAAELLKMNSSKPQNGASAANRADEDTPIGTSSDPETKLIFNPKDPMPIAKAFLEAHYSHADGAILVYDGGQFYFWNGMRWSEYSKDAIRALLYSWLQTAKKWQTVGKALELVKFQPNQPSVNHINDALESAVYRETDPPAWLVDDPNLPDPRDIIPAPNGLVHLTLAADPKIIRPPTPIFYSHNAIDFAFDPSAPEPKELFKFLDQILPDDRESVELLQEWFGYCLVGDTRQQKALLIVGPKRAGKGTIARILTRLLGAANVCAPTLSGLAGNFGLWSLIGKLLAIVSDARLTGRVDQGIIIERILALTGEDSLDIDRKNMEIVTIRLHARLLILTNELPRLADASGALASRFLVLNLTESFYGREDTGLEDRLAAELPGILNWAIAGWRRLNARGHFIQPSTAADAIDEMNDLASPVSAFVRDFCKIDRGLSVSVSDIYAAWCAWSKQQGREQAGTIAVFGRDLRASVAGIGLSNRRGDEGRQRQYEGIGLTESAKHSAAQWRSTQKNGGAS